MRRLVALLSVAVLVGCDHASHGVRAAGDRAGLKLRMTLTASHSSFVVDTHVENRRPASVHLVPDQCGRITEVILARTRFEPPGRRWRGSLGVVKRYILDDQRNRQDPDPFRPRKPVPRCERPKLPITLAPGKTVDERWELPFTDAAALAAVGSAHSVVQAALVEARDPNEPEYLDMLPPGAAVEARRSRSLRMRAVASRVVERAPTDRAHPSLGQLYDRLLADTKLRAWLVAQPAGSWRAAQLLQFPSVLRFKAISSLYERAATATAQPDGSDVKTHVPASSDRARVWARRPATLPPGIRLIAEAKSWRPTDDVIAAPVELPSGRIVVGEYLLDTQPLHARAESGTYAVFATLARYPHDKFDSVALATLVLSRHPTVRWRNAAAIAVDGGTTTITSAEGAAFLRNLFHRSEPRWEQLSDETFDSLTAHDYQVTEFSLGHGLNLAQFSSGIGDGRYPVFVGFDTSGHPTRVVVDFLLLHLKWA